MGAGDAVHRGHFQGRERRFLDSKGNMGTLECRDYIGAGLQMV